MADIVTAERARDFARLYVQLTTALMHEGVEEDVARTEAHMAATAWLMDELDQVRNPCPLCGNN